MNMLTPQIGTEKLRVNLVKQIEIGVREVEDKKREDKEGKNLKREERKRRNRMVERLEIQITDYVLLCLSACCY